MNLNRVLCALLLSLSLCVSAQDLDALWDFERPALSEARFKAAYTEETDPSLRGILLTQMARAQGLRQEYAEAHRTLDSLRESLFELSPLVSIRYALERGRLLNAAKQPAKAQRWFRGGLLLAQRQAERSTDDLADLEVQMIDAMHMLAITEKGQTALDWNTKALDLAEASSHARTANWKGSLYNNIGWNYYDQKNYPKALEYMRKALAWHEERQTGRPVLIARWSVGKLLRMSGEPEKALLLQYEAERGFALRKEEDGYVFEEIGENLRVLGRHEEAKSYFAKAYALLSQDAWLSRTDPTRLERLQGLAK